MEISLAYSSGKVNEYNSPTSVVDALATLYSGVLLLEPLVSDLLDIDSSLPPLCLQSISVDEVTNDMPAKPSSSRKSTKPQARRQLFQDENQPPEGVSVPPQITQSELERAREELAMARWNFDFANEEPLDGYWEWEPVESYESRHNRNLNTKNP
ncbi:hypothetical protein Trydic_g7534 [Trypoxylus dichotomus]